MFVSSAIQRRRAMIVPHRELAHFERSGLARWFTRVSGSATATLWESRPEPLLAARRPAQEGRDRVRLPVAR